MAIKTFFRLTSFGHEVALKATLSLKGYQIMFAKRFNNLGPSPSLEKLTTTTVVGDGKEADNKFQKNLVSSDGFH